MSKANAFQILKGTDTHPSHKFDVVYMHPDMVQHASYPDLVVQATDAGLKIRFHASMPMGCMFSFSEHQMLEKMMRADGGSGMFGIATAFSYQEMANNLRGQKHIIDVDQKD